MPCGQRDGSLWPDSLFSRQEPLCFLPNKLLNCTHEAECIPLQTHYYSEKFGKAGNWTQTSGSVARNSDHYNSFSSLHFNVFCRGNSLASDNIRKVSESAMLSNMAYLKLSSWTSLWCMLGEISNTLQGIILGNLNEGRWEVQDM
jgi:hypothetical protein